MRALRVVVAALLLASLLAPAVDAQGSTSLIIDSRDDWLRESVPGNGTAADPFVLEGMRFDMDARARNPALVVRDVPDHVVVRHVLVFGGKTGILVLNAPNVTIENVTVRRADTGFDVTNARLVNVTAAENKVGIKADNVTIHSALLVDNAQGINGHVRLVSRSVFLDNPYGIQLAYTGTLPPGKPVPRIEHSRFENSGTAAVFASRAVTVVNSTFEANKVGFHYRGTEPGASVRGSDFGVHATAAAWFDLRREVDWDVDARDNWWGHASGPSPEGFGAPIAGDVRYRPFRATPHDFAPLNGSGATFNDTAAPRIADSGSSVEPKPGQPSKLSIRLRATDPDGVAGFVVTVVELDQTVRGRARGTPDGSFARSFDLPEGTRVATLHVQAYDLYGNTAETNLTVRPRPPPAPPAENGTGENEAPGASVLAFLAVLGAAAVVRARRR